jgi:hypothetical protein
MTFSDEWSTIPGFGGKYSISRSGEIRSAEHTVRRRDGKTQTFRSRTVRHYQDGPYWAVTLNSAGKSTHAWVHRLLAQAFIPNTEGLPVVRHLNDDGLDLRIENLAWGTQSDNLRDCVRNGGHAQANKAVCIRGHEFIQQDGRRRCMTCAARKVSCVICGRVVSKSNMARHARRWHESSDEHGVEIV